jgi:hypothetical protein
MGGGGAGIAGSGGALWAMSVVAAIKTSEAESSVLLMMFIVTTSFIPWRLVAANYSVSGSFLSTNKTKGGAQKPRLEFTSRPNAGRPA